MSEGKGNDSKKFDHVRIITNPLSTNKTLNADVMIENILSKKQVFKKKPSSQFPPWLSPKSGKVPQFFSQVWKVVKCTSNPGFCNTPVLSQVLITSGLSTQVLGFIWNLVNNKCIGVLTEEELYLALALIALYQNGAVVRDLEMLKQVQQPIIPRLDINALKQYSHKVYPTNVSNLQTHPYFVPNPTPMYHMPPGVDHTTNTPLYTNTNSAQFIPMSNHKTSAGSSNVSEFSSSVPNWSNTNVNVQGALLNTDQKPCANTFLKNMTDWSCKDDDEFTEFQSSVTLDSQSSTQDPVQNVSITLNPIDNFFTSTEVTFANKNKDNADVYEKDIDKKAEKSNFIEDDDFTEFQSSVTVLDFDVEIKQPNLLHNIKSIVDAKYQADNLKGDDSVSLNSLERSMNNCNDLDKTDSIIPSKNIQDFDLQTTKSDLRDYSALKDLQLEESIFDIDRTSKYLLNDARGNVDTDLFVLDTKDSYKTDIYATKIEQTSPTINDFNNDIKSITELPDINPMHSLYSMHNITSGVKNTDVDTMSDDGFTDFVQALPKDNANTFNDNSQSIKNVQSSIVPSTAHKEHNLNVDATNMLFDVSDEVLIEKKINETSVFDDLTDIKQALNADDTIVFVNTVSLNTNNSHNINVRDVLKTTDILANDDKFDEFAEFKQAPICIDSIQTQTLMSTYDEQLQNKLESIDSKKTDTNEEKTLEKSKQSIDNSVDKYSAFREIETFTEYDDDGDDLEKEKDSSDGDSTSLQLPCIESHDSSTIQTKCYEACIYTLETSLQILSSSKIYLAAVNHPKISAHLESLYQVYLVGTRIQKSGINIPNSSNSRLNILWNALSVYIFDLTPFESHVAVESTTTSEERCEICLCGHNDGNLITEKNAKYHPQCANLYTHCVDSVLPVSSSVS